METVLERVGSSNAGEWLHVPNNKTVRKWLSNLFTCYYFHSVSERDIDHHAQLDWIYA